jgi:hypothetical protein
MSEKEIIEAIRILGRYVIDSLPGGILFLPHWRMGKS